MFRLQHKTFFTLVAILCMLLSTTSYASAWVTTDQEDYAPGSIVTISGGNDESGGPGYVPGTTVNIVITGPHDPAYEATTCENVVVGEDGAWSCTLTLWADPEWALGTYVYTARSAAADGSQIEETGTFTDSRSIKSVTLTASGTTVPPGQLTVNGGATISAQVTVETVGGWQGNDDWKSTAWKMIQTPINWSYLISHPLELLDFIESLTEWNCVNHADYTSAGTWNRTINIPVPSTAGTYTVFFYAFATDACFPVFPTWSNPYWLADSILVPTVKAAGSVSINNIPSNAVDGGSFTPAFNKLGDGTTSVVSLTPATCTVTSGVVDYVGAGTCTLQASVAEGTNYLAATVQQSFTINKATLNVTASSPAAGKYGDPVPTITVGYSGFVLGDGAGDLDTAPTCSTTYTQGSAPGDYPTSCSGGADGNYDFSYVAGNFHVDKAFTTTGLNISSTSALLNQPMTFTATVSPVSPATGIPGGSVSFYDATTLLATKDLVNGQTEFITSSLALGSHSITAVYSGDTSWEGSTSNAVTVKVTYQFIGFSQPVDNGILNVAKAGQSIPLKFRLVDYNGVPITSLASVSVTTTSLSCSAGTVLDVIEEYAAGSSGLQNLGDGYYQWNWKTPTTYANSCKKLKLDLGEGAGNEHTALFQFKK